MPTGSQVEWLGGLLPTWNLLHRPHYLDQQQLAGIVFNRASQGDLDDSDYTSYRNSQRSAEGLSANGHRERVRRLGPVARAVVDAEPASEAPSED